MATPKWTYNRLIRNINTIDEVLQDMNPETHSYKKLKRVRESLTGLTIILKKESK